MVERSRLRGWLMRGECNHSNALLKTAASLSEAAYWFPTRHKRGETMNMQTQMAVRETLRDFMVVSAFCFWAVVIGFVPVIAIYTLFT